MKECFGDRTSFGIAMPMRCVDCDVGREYLGFGGFAVLALGAEAEVARLRDLLQTDADHASEYRARIAKLEAERDAARAELLEAEVSVSETFHGIVILAKGIIRDKADPDRVISLAEQLVRLVENTHKALGWDGEAR